MTDAALKEVTQRLLALSKRQRDDECGEFKRMMLRVPLVRAQLKEGYSFLDGSPSSILKIWDHIWKNSEWYEVMSQALHYYQGKDLNKAEFNKIKTWVNRCHCWEHSDDLSKIFADVVEENPDWILPTLEKWNSSASPWKRRQSVVALIEYASKRKSVLPFKQLISFVDNLLGDPEYYVQKGVGWTLREIGNVYPALTLKFL